MEVEDSHAEWRVSSPTIMPPARDLLLRQVLHLLLTGDFLGNNVDGSESWRSRAGGERFGPPLPALHRRCRRADGSFVPANVRHCRGEFTMDDMHEIKELLREIRDLQKAHFERYK